MQIPADLLITAPMNFTFPGATGDVKNDENAILVLTNFVNCTITVNGVNPLDNAAGLTLAVINPGDAVVITPTAAVAWARGHYDFLPGRVVYGHRYARATWSNASRMSSSMNKFRTTFTTTREKPYGTGKAEATLILTSFSSLAQTQAKLYDSGGNLLATYRFDSEVIEYPPALGATYRARFLPDNGWPSQPDTIYTLEVSKPDNTGSIRALVGSTDPAFDSGPNGSALLGVKNLSSQYTTTSNATLTNAPYHLLFEIGDAIQSEPYIRPIFKFTNVFATNGQDMLSSPYPVWELRKITTSVPTTVAVYASTTDRTADANRLQTNPTSTPASNAPLAQITTTAAALTVPVMKGFSQATVYLAATTAATVNWVVEEV